MAHGTSPKDRTARALAAVAGVTSVLGSEAPPDRVFAAVVEAAAALGYPEACVYRALRNGPELRCLERRGALTPAREGAPADALAGGEPRWERSPGGMAVWVPVRSGEQVVGLVGARRPGRRAPSARDLSVLRILADLVGMVLENQALREANEARIRQFLAVQRVSREMASTLDLERLLHLVVDEASQLTGAEAGSLYLAETPEGKLRLVAWAGVRPPREEIPLGYGIPGWVAQHGRALRVEDGSSQGAGNLEQKNHLAVPLLSEGKVVGALCVEARGDRPFTPTHEEVLGIFAAQVAKSIEAARYFRQIREERDLRDGILSGTPNGVVALDRSRKVVLMNPAARRLLGVSEPPEGNAVERYLTEPAFQESLRRVLDGRTDLEQVTLVRGRGSGARHLQVSLFPLGEKASLGATLIVQDLTERKRLDERVQRMARLAAIGQLAAGVAHEIRNPLTGIAISLDVLREEEGLDEAGRGLVEDMHREIDRLEALIRGLLDFARPQPVEARPMRIAKALEWHRTFEKQCRSKGIDFAIDFGPNPKLRGDPEKLKQLFLNLAINALEATPPGGRIRVRAERRPGRWVRVVVEDTGPGMDEDTLAQIFDPFFTTKNEGTGLGLSIAHSIVEQHGGRIDVESTPGEGTRFTVELPGMEEPDP